MKYNIIAVFVICLILGTGLAAAGTLTLHLDPSLNGKGDIRATSITDAKLLRIDYNGGNYTGTVKTVTGVAARYTALFNLSGIAPGDYFIRVNNLTDNPIPTRIDDPTKDINQFIGENLQVSIIGNLSDPTYQIKMVTKTNGVTPIIHCTDATGVEEDGTFVYVIQSLKTKPQKLEIKYVLPENWYLNITDYTPSAPTHPSTMTSINPPFSKWAFGESSHGVDYSGNDSKCSACHGNLDTKPANLDTIRDNFTDIPVNNGFCFRCHYGKSGTDVGFLGESGCQHPYPFQGTPETTTAKPTQVSTTSTPETPAFEALSAIAALMVVVLIGKK